MLVGIEVEFFVFSGYSRTFLSPEVKEKYELVPEYYDGMYEKTFLHRNGIALSLIIKTLSQVSSEGFTVPVKSVLIPVKEGAVSCGIHLHLDPDRFSEVLFFALLWRKFLKNPSLRFLHSHHVWGAVRPYSRAWKRNPRYRPYAVSPEREDKPETVEVRIYDTEDLANGVLHDAVLVLKGKKSFSKEEVEKGRDLFQELKSINFENIFEETAERDPSPEAVKMLVNTLSRITKNISFFEEGKRKNLIIGSSFLTPFDGVRLHPLIREEVRACAG